MGYCIDVVDHYILIPTEQKAAALEAIKAMAVHDNKMGGGRYSGGDTPERWFSWVDMTQLANANTLKEAFDAWRYAFSENDDGVFLDWFEGEKLGDDDFLWNTMAPFIKDGGFIEVHGEDNFYWRWKFNDGKCREVELHLTEI